MIKSRRDAPEQTGLDRTAFRLIGATTRDNRRRIVELAEEKSLSLDGDVSSQARAQLTNPRNRVTAEVAWLPGLSPARADAYCDLLKHDLDRFLTSAVNESPLVRANLIAAAFERFDPDTDGASWVRWVTTLADAANQIDSEAVLRLLNEDRAVAAFPEIPTVDAVDEELEARRRVYRETVKDALNRIKTAELVQVVTDVVEAATANGTQPGPILIDDIIDDFDVGIRPFLDRETENVRLLINTLRRFGTRNEVADNRILDAVERVVRNWYRVARPIEVSMQVRGREYTPSRDLVYEIRGLGIEMFNQHGELGPAQRLTGLLQELFGGVGTMVGQLQDDAKALANLAQQQRENRNQGDQWTRDIAYAAELGLVFKSSLRLSADGLEWKNSHYSLESITRIGWGLGSGDTLVILFGDAARLSEVQLTDRRIFSDFVPRLWRAVGARLLIELLGNLRKGDRYQLGPALLDDKGIELPKRRLFKPDEKVYCTWGQVEVSATNTSFSVYAKADVAARVWLPYNQANNAHVLEAAIGTAIERRNSRLSDFLDP